MPYKISKNALNYIYYTAKTIDKNNSNFEMNLELLLNLIDLSI